MDETREQLITNFILMELIRVGHAYQIVMSVIRENSKDVSPSINQEKLINQIITNFDSVLHLVTTTFDEESIKTAEAEIMKTYKVVSEESNGNESEAKQAE